MLLIRLCGEQGVLMRANLRRDKALKLRSSLSRPPVQRGREGADAGGGAEVAHAADDAALALDLNTGLRDKELREIRWEQIDLVHKKALTVGKSKTEAGTGRVIPLNETALAASRPTRPGTRGGSGHAGRSGLCSPSGRHSPKIRRAQSRRSRQRGPRSARRPG